MFIIVLAIVSLMTVLISFDEQCVYLRAYSEAAYWMRLHCVIFDSEAVMLLTYRNVPGSKLGLGSDYHD
jgi:hypothetical protein